MRLSLVFFRKNQMPNGHIFRGKDRLVKKVEPKHLRQMQQDFAIEEQNMFYLRFPYLTKAESEGHSKALGKQEKRIQKMKENDGKIFKQDVTLFERFKHLRVNESWE